METTTTTNKQTEGTRTLLISEEITNPPAPSFSPANNVNKTASTLDKGNVSKAQGIARKTSTPKYETKSRIGIFTINFFETRQSTFILSYDEYSTKKKTETIAPA
ncbi:MAG: hypothetical protein IJ905_10890 [Fibrobacter sp.]|nr:hypothetical protein [Fibrobacter sp.]